MSLMSKLTASYIAGFIDGEGYIGIIKDSRKIGFRRQDSYEAVLKIANTNKQIIDWFQESFGGNVSSRVLGGNAKDAYCWQISGEKLVPFLDKISPFLKMKGKQAEIVRKLRKTVSPESYTYPTREAKNGGKFRSKTLKPEIIGIRENLYQQIRELNKRGNSAR